MLAAARRRRSTTCACGAFPFGEEVESVSRRATRLLFVVEQNRDAQLRSLLTLETAVEKTKLRSLLHYNGLPISCGFIVEGVPPSCSRARSRDGCGPSARRCGTETS